MKTNEFISKLRAAPENRLIFVDLEGHAVHSGYHLTELKAASLKTVDCGGQTNQWEETTAQLWVPSNPDSDYTTAGKFLKIFDKVSGIIPLNLDTEIRVEYGDENFFPSAYHVRSVTHVDAVTRVLLEPPRATCKARGRDECCNANPASESCCA